MFSVTFARSFTCLIKSSKTWICVQARSPLARFETFANGTRIFERILWNRCALCLVRRSKGGARRLDTRDSFETRFAPFQFSHVCTCSDPMMWLLLCIPLKLEFPIKTSDRRFLYEETIYFIYHLYISFFMSVQTWPLTNRNGYINFTLKIVLIWRFFELKKYLTHMYVRCNEVCDFQTHVAPILTIYYTLTMLIKAQIWSKFTSIRLFDLNGPSDERMKSQEW